MRLPTLLGAAILVLCIGGFGVWASIAPLEGAVVVSGSFVANGQNKLIQHLEGGILRETLVKEGDLVESGQPLLRLDPTSAQAKLRRLVLRKYRLVVTKARLEAEIDEHAELRMPETLKAEAADAEVLAIFDRQSCELRARRREAVDGSRSLAEGDRRAEREHQRLHVAAAIGQRAPFTLRRGAEGQAACSRASWRGRRKCWRCSAPRPAFRANSAR